MQYVVGNFSAKTHGHLPFALINAIIILRHVPKVGELTCHFRVAVYTCTSNAH